MIKFLKFFLIFFLLNFSFVYSEILTFDISNENVNLSNDLKKSDFVVYGFTDFKDSIVLKIKGPLQKVILQKKTKIFNMWTWNKTGEFRYPGLFHFYTNKKSEEIDFEIKKDLVDNIKLFGIDDDNLKRELIEKKRSIDLFLIKNNSFQSVNKGFPNFFKIPIKLPSNSPAGKYKISMSIVGKGNSYNTKEKNILVKKQGISSFVYQFAHKYSFIYGIFSAIIAIGFGLLAGVIFRKRT